MPRLCLWEPGAKPSAHSGTPAPSGAPDGTFLAGLPPSRLPDSTSAPGREMLQIPATQPTEPPPAEPPPQTWAAVLSLRGHRGTQPAPAQVQDSGKTERQKKSAIVFLSASRAFCPWLWAAGSSWASGCHQIGQGEGLTTGPEKRSVLNNNIFFKNQAIRNKLLPIKIESMFLKIKNIPVE